MPISILWWCLAAALFSIGCGIFFLRHIQRFLRAPVREFVTQHQAKDQTPTAGGVFFIAAFALILLCWSSWSDIRLWLVIAATLGFGAIGLWDDLAKIIRKKGISERQKFSAQVVVATLILSGWYFFVHPSTMLYAPFFPSLSLDIGILLIPWGIWILLSTTNAVNLTDGLDGLAGSLVAIVCTVFGIIALLNGDLWLMGTAFLFASTLAGFLWFNAHPAQVFMGDVGSLACGGFMGLLALMTRHELFLPIAAGVMVTEVLSVMLQVAVFKRTGKRIFRMAPFHHHLEALGIAETKITARFILITIMLGLITLAAY